MDLTRPSSTPITHDMYSVAAASISGAAFLPPQQHQHHQQQQNQHQHQQHPHQLQMSTAPSSYHHQPILPAPPHQSPHNPAASPPPPPNALQSASTDSPHLQHAARRDQYVSTAPPAHTGHQTHTIGAFPHMWPPSIDQQPTYHLIPQTTASLTPTTAPPHTQTPPQPMNPTAWMWTANPYPMIPKDAPRTQVVGSQGRRGILPSLPSRVGKPAVIAKDEDGKFPCPHCNKTYLHAKHLKRHLLRHTGDRPYMCVLCKDTFSRSDILKRHFEKCSIRRGNPTGLSHLSHPLAHRKNAQAAGILPKDPPAPPNFMLYRHGQPQAPPLPHPLQLPHGYPQHYPPQPSGPHAAAAHLPAQHTPAPAPDPADQVPITTAAAAAAAPPPPPDVASEVSHTHSSTPVQ